MGGLGVFWGFVVVFVIIVVVLVLVDWLVFCLSVLVFDGFFCFFKLLLGLVNFHSSGLFWGFFFWCVFYF